MDEECKHDCRDLRVRAFNLTRYTESLDIVDAEISCGLCHRKWSGRSVMAVR